MTNYGEKGHVQQGWIKYHLKNMLNSTDIHDYIVQLNFQLVRSHDLHILKYQWNHLLKFLFSDTNKYLDEIITICKLILYTRDIDYGKGERKLSYMLLLELYNHNQEIAIMLFENFVTKLSNKTTIGCWKDVKRFSQYIYDETKNQNHPFILYMIEISNIYLTADHKQITQIYELFKDKDKEKIKKYIQNNVELHMVAKWLPRKSLNNNKYGWLFNKLADNMFKHYFKTIYKSKGNVDYKKLRKAINKSEMNYRKMLSFVNKHLNVVEILQTSHNTNKIDFTKLSSLSRERYHKSFLKSSANNECKNNYKDFISTKNYIYTHQHLYEIIRNIIVNKLWLKKKDDLTRMMVVKLWKTKQRYIKNMENIPIVDTSQSMNGIPLYNSIGLGIFISEHNHKLFKNKLLTFGNKPKLLEFTDKMDICDKVKCIVTDNINVNSDLYSVFNMLIDTVKRYKLSVHELKSYSLTILSDMQIEDNVDIKNPCMYSNIKMMFDIAQIDMPQVIFWNLKLHNGFPVSTIHDYTKILMISGFNENHLSIFNSVNTKNMKKDDTKNMKKENTKVNRKYNLLFDILDNKRYSVVNKEVVNILLL